MFCSKCGKPLAEDAVFCSACGAKVITESAGFTAPEFSRPVVEPKVERPVYDEPVPARRPEPVSPLAFDWSEVIEESHKKTVPQNIRSPWEPTGIDDEYASSTTKIMEDRKPERFMDDDFFADLEKPSTSPSRTMSFIDLLKAEREEKEKSAYEAARKVTEREETPFDMSAFDEKPDFRYSDEILPEKERELTRGYTDLADDVVASIRRREAAPAGSELDEYLKLRSESRSLAQDIVVEEPQQFVTPAEDETEKLEKEYQEKSNNIDAELAAILGVGAFVGAEKEPSISLFEDEPETEAEVDDAMLDLYASDDDDWNDDDAYDVSFGTEDDDKAIEPVVDTAAPVAEPVAETSPEDDLSALIAGILGSEPAPVVAEEEPVELDSSIEDLYASIGDDMDKVEEETPAAPAVEIPEVEIPVAEEPAVDPAQAALDAKEAEIEALKAKLAALMGESIDEPVEIAKQDTPDIDELIAEPVAETAPAAPVAEDDIFAVELDNLVEEDEEPVVEIPVVEEPEAVIEIPAATEPVVEAVVEPVVETPVADTVIGGGDDVLDLDAELASLGFFDDEPAVAAEEPVIEIPTVTEPVVEAVLEPTVEPVAEIPAAPETDAMSIEDLEKDLFGDDLEADGEAEATRKIDKFYTLYKKNEEFQKLLDEEYSKLQGVESSDDLDAFFGVTEEAPQEEAPAVDPIEEFVSQQQPIGQMSAPANSQLQSAGSSQQTSGTVSSQEIPAKPAAETIPAIIEEEEPQQLSKKELRAQKKAAKKAAKNAPVIDEDDDEEEGGNALTIIAVIIAILLVILLAAIILMNFAGDTAIGMKLTQFVENLSSYVSGIDAINDDFLL